MWRRRPQGGGSGRPFRETRPRGPPPRLSTPCPLVRPLLHPAVGPRARRAPRRAVDVAGGRGARQLAGRKRRPAPPGKAEVSGEVTAGGEHRSHRAPGAPIACGPAAPAPGGAAGGGARPRGPDGGGDTWPLRGSSRAAREGGWRPGRTGGSTLSPRRSLRFAVPPAGSREAPWAFRRIFGARGLGAEGGTALSRVRRHGAPLPAPVPLAPAPVFRETRPHQGAGFHLRAPVPRSGTQGAPCDRCCGEGVGEAPAGRPGLPS